MKKTGQLVGWACISSVILFAAIWGGAQLWPTSFDPQQQAEVSQSSMSTSSRVASNEAMSSESSAHTPWQFDAARNIWQYLDESGNAHVGWLTLENQRYYFNEAGEMLTGWQYVSGWYYFASSGEMIQERFYDEQLGLWYQPDDTGVMHPEGTGVADLSRGFRVIVNKQFRLPADYYPGENPEAATQFHRLLADLRAQGFDVSTQYSGFRSFEHQQQLYQQYVSEHGKEAADRFSARPGHSEHQTGLAYDLVNAHGELLEEHDEADGPAADWVAANAHRYGFVVRYLPGKEAITGYNAEPWHLRYVGDDAPAIYQSGLTLEEFYHIPGGDYAPQ